MRFHQISFQSHELHRLATRLNGLPSNEWYYVQNERKKKMRRKLTSFRRMVSHAAHYFAYIVRVLSIRMISVRGSHVSWCYSDYGIYIDFSVFPHVFAFISFRCSHCDDKNSMQTLYVYKITIHSFLHKFSFACLSCSGSPAARTKRSYYINLLRVSYRKFVQHFCWMEKLCQRQHRCHLRVTLAFCAIELLRGQFYHDKRFCSACAKFKRKWRK